MELQKKREQIIETLEAYGKKGSLCVAFSGGVDSSLLLYLAVAAGKKYGNPAYALTADTVLHPKSDLETAKEVAAQAKARHRVLFVDELKDPKILKNPVDRCYLCKKQLFLEFQKLSRKLGASCLLEGSNGDDLQVYRPGIRAVRELGVISPLADAGLTKEEVRAWAKELGISTAARPSTPCMATRIPYGQPLEPGLFRQIEAGEALLRARGFLEVRIRLHGEVLRLEIPPQSFPSLLEQRASLISALKSLGFRYLTLDLEGFRSGSMDEYL